MNKLIAILLCCGFLTGCATPIPKIDGLHGTSLAPMKSEKVAISYTLARKRINYLETLYRVVMLETKTSSQDFSGIWSPDRDLSNYALPLLKENGVDAYNVHDIVENSIISNANEEIGRKIFDEAVTEHAEIKGTKLLPNPDYFANSITTDHTLKLLSALKEKNIRYLVQLTAMDIYGNAIGYGGVVVLAQPNVRVVDVANGKVIWSANYSHSEVYQLGGNLKKLEIDSMAKTKEGLQAGIKKMPLATQMGLVDSK